MTLLAREATICRVCRSILGPYFLDLGNQTLANNLCSGDYNGHYAGEDPRAPLRLVRCEHCSLVQLTHVVDPVVLFSHYLYTPSQSGTFRRHFRDLAQAVTQRRGRGIAFDIGSNDGLLLSYFKTLSWTVAGIDPAKNLAEQTNRAGIPTLCDFWNHKTAQRMADEFGEPDVITATNVFAHNDDVHEFIAAAKSVLRPGGEFIIEVPYLPIMLRDGTFDLCYSEHRSYFSLLPIVRLMEEHGLEVCRAEIVPIHGGSLRFSARAPNGHQDHVGVHELLESEKREGLDSAAPYERFAHRAAVIHDALVDLVRGEAAQGRVVGYGAPAKATVLVNYCGFTPRDIEYIVDDNPLKQGLYLPGSHIPIRKSSALDRAPPRAVIIFPWNLADEISQKLPAGVTVIVPLPHPRVLNVRG